MSFDSGEPITRRVFLRASSAGGALILTASLVPINGAGAAADDDPRVWVSIAGDNQVTIRVAQSEMGQGVFTALPMILADELGADWRMVRAEMAPVAAVYRNRMIGAQATGGSTSVRGSFDLLRQVGAAAREMFLLAAAEEWRAPITSLQVRDGFVVQEGSTRRASFGSLAGAAARQRVPANPALKPREAWTLIGKSVPRLDGPAKVSGAAIFGTDVRVDGMLTGTVKACPVFGGTLKRVNPKPAMAVRGVHAVIPLHAAVIVVGDGFWPAYKGLQALKPEWDKGRNAGVSNKFVSETLRAGLARSGVVIEEEGNVGRALQSARQKVEAVYSVPYLAHATMEPMVAAAHIKADEVLVWAPTQAQSRTQQAVARLLRRPEEQVQVFTTFLGGGFGRRSEVDFVLYAVEAARAVDRPVKVIWTREEDFRHDFYRPAAMMRLQGGIDGEGRLTAWNARIAAPSRGLAVSGAVRLPYAIPARRTEFAERTIDIPIGAWRSVAHSQNAFFVECFIDELAAAAKKDPVQFRLQLLGDKPRHRAVLETAASLAGWGQPLSRGQGRGLALHESFGSIVAQVAQVSVDPQNRLRVEAVACVVDCGMAVNPNTIEAQMESGIVYGLTAALWGGMTVDGGAAREGNFDAQPLLKLDQMPKLAIRIIESGDRLGGIGEPATPPIAPAVVNAVHAATGRRVRTLPLANQGFRVA